MCDVLTVHDPLEECVFFDTSNCFEKYITRCPILEIRYSDICDLYFCPENLNSNNNSINKSIQSGEGYVPVSIQTPSFGLNFNVTLNENQVFSDNNLGLILGCVFGMFGFAALCLLIWKFGAKIWIRLGFGQVQINANFQREAFAGDLSVLL